MRKEPVSVIIPCLNNLGFTKKTLEGVLSKTQVPFEIIVVDNGSSDGTSEYLEGMKSEAGIRVIRNSLNRGAPAAFNQGIRVASSRYIIFLNNDTIVTESWTGKMLEKFLNIPRAGAVVPCFNPSGRNDMDPANIAREAAYLELSRKDEFQYIPGATTCCLLTGKDVIERAGFFDEGYGLGTNDDHDFCLRLRLAGFKIICALDTFIFHYYSRTLGGFDMVSLDRRNREYFLWKFGNKALEYLEGIGQPYGSRGERPREVIISRDAFPEPV